MRKLLVAVLALLCMSSVAFASVGVQDNGTYEGEATTINFDNGATVSFDGGVATVDVGALTNYEVFTTGDTLVAADSGKAVISYLNDADGIVDFVLPAVSAGLKFKFSAGHTSYIRIDPAGTNQIMYSTCAAGDRILSAGASADSVELVSDGTRWYVTGMKGTWTDGN